MGGSSNKKMEDPAWGRSNMSQGPLDPATAALVRLAAAVAEGDVSRLQEAVPSAPGRGVLGTAQQLHSHLRGALNTGASVEQVEAVLELVGPDLDREFRQRALEQWEDVKDRRL